jgi:hypothetical protein
MKVLLALLMVAVLLTAGCVSQTVITEEPDTLTDLGNDIAGLDSLESDLDMSDLENLDSELEDLNW